MSAFCTQQLQGEAKLAWSRAESVTSVQQHLDSTFTRLQSQVEVDHRNVDSLVAAVALLCGALYPLFLRASELATQRNLLAAQLQQFDAFKQQVNVTYMPAFLTHKLSLHMNLPLAESGYATVWRSSVCLSRDGERCHARKTDGLSLKVSSGGTPPPRRGEVTPA